MINKYLHLLCLFVFMDINAIGMEAPGGPSQLNELMHAIGNSDTLRIKEILKSNKSILYSSKDEQNLTPLCKAVSTLNPDILHLILQETNGDPNIKCDTSRFGWVTPLSLIMNSRQFADVNITNKMITLLLDHGAQIEGGTLTAQEIKDDMLPSYTLDQSTNQTDRDNLLMAFYDEVIPIFISWHVAKGKYFSIFDPTVGEIPKHLHTPFPFNPYREPGMNKLFLFPGNEDQWTKILDTFKFRIGLHKYFIQNSKEILKDLERDNIMIIKAETDLGLPDSLDLFRSVLTNPSAYTVDEFKAHQKLREIANNLLKGGVFKHGVFNKGLVGLGKLDLSKHPNFKNNLEAFIRYHEHQLKKITYFLNMVDPMIVEDKGIHSVLEVSDFFKELPFVHMAMKRERDQTEEKPKGEDENRNKIREQIRKQILPRLRPFFLSGQQRAHDLIKIKNLQDYPTGEVIVMDSNHTFSDRLTYSPLAAQSKLSEEERNWASSQTSLKTGAHSTSVAGIIGGSHELGHLKGVTPGAKILPIEANRVVNKSILTQGNLDLIKKSKARVINASIYLKIPLNCHAYFMVREPADATLTETQKFQTRTLNHKKLGRGNEQCAALWDLFQLIQEKDMLLVLASGNEGLQIDHVDWPTGKIQGQNHHMTGLQYEKNIDPGFDGSNVDIVHLMDQIPQLKNRLILVGNLMGDGVTVDPSSNLPGSFSQNFIYAPSEGISSLSFGSDSMLTTPKGKQIFTEISPFGGTSGAAPRVAGVAVLLGRVFPDLPMMDIRECILTSGDPFWMSKLNKFEGLKSICGDEQTQCLIEKKACCLNPYGQRILGQYGRLNAQNAYNLCLEKSQKKREKDRQRSGFDAQLVSPLVSLDYKENPLYRIMNMKNQNMVTQSMLNAVFIYYNSHPQHKVTDKNLGFVPPLEIAVHLSNSFPHLIQHLLTTFNPPILTKSDASKILEHAFKIGMAKPDFIVKNMRLFKLLLDQGADPNVLINGRYLPLYAILSAPFKMDYLSLAKLFIDQGADIHSVSMGGKSILENLVSPDVEIEKIKFLLFFGARINDIVYQQAKRLDRKDLIILFDQFMNNAQNILLLNNSNSQSNLAQTNDLKNVFSKINSEPLAPLSMIKLLLDKGADPNTLIFDETPLQQMFDGKLTPEKVSTIHLLLHYGANPEDILKADISPLKKVLDQPLTQESIDVAKLLLKAGANPNITLENGGTPIAGLAWYYFWLDKNLDLLKLLIEKGANLKTGNRFNVPLLTNVDNYSVMKLLLEKGADPNIESNGTYLENHFDHLSIDMIKLLLDNSANPYGWDADSGESLVVHAHNAGREDVAKLLEEYMKKWDNKEK